MKKTLILGDIHFPFHNKKALKEVMYAIKHERPSNVIQIGDLFDQYSFSRFTRKNITLPQQELKEARDLSRRLWSDVQKAVPRASLYQILGNHDIRLIKRAEERLPEAQTLVKESLMELYRFKGVTTIEDDREILKIGDVSFHHGFLSQLGAHRDKFLTNTVVGHSHTGGVSFRQIHGKTLWELNVGFLADETSEPLKYNPSRSSKWTLGFGLITYRGRVACPQFIPLC